MKKASVKIDARLYELLRILKEELRRRDTHISVTELVEAAIIFALRHRDKFGVFLLFRFDLAPSELGPFPELVEEAIERVEKLEELVKRASGKRLT